MTEKELVYRALLGDLLSPTQKAKLGAGDTAAALRRFELEYGSFLNSQAAAADRSESATERCL